MLKSLLIFLCCLGLAVNGISAVSAEETPIPAQRIVALAPHIVESLFAIGAGEQVIATVEYADYPTKALAIPRVGGYYGLQIEKILQLAPDLIIVWKNGNKAEDIQKLERLGLPIKYSKPKSIDGVAQELIWLGELTGHQGEASRLATDYQNRLSQLRLSYQNKSPIRVFYQLWSEPLMSVNKNTWIHQLLTTCGAVNVFANNPTDYPQLSLENVLVTHPDLIIMPQEKSKQVQPKINWQQFSMIPAVKHNRFMQVDADLIHRFSPRMLIGLEDMCKKIEASRQTMVSQ